MDNQHVQEAGFVVVDPDAGQQAERQPLAGSTKKSQKRQRQREAHKAQGRDVTAEKVAHNHLGHMRIAQGCLRVVPPALQGRKYDVSRGGMLVPTVHSGHIRPEVLVDQPFPLAGCPALRRPWLLMSILFKVQIQDQCQILIIYTT